MPIEFRSVTPGPPLVLGGVGAGIVFEKRHDDGDRLQVHIADGPESARIWVDSHYDGVDWESPHRAVASIAQQPRYTPPSPCASETRAWEHRPLTYETDELRTHLPELVTSVDYATLSSYAELAVLLGTARRTCGDLRRPDRGPANTLRAADAYS